MWSRLPSPSPSVDPLGDPDPEFWSNPYWWLGALIILGLCVVIFRRHKDDV